MDLSISLQYPWWFFLCCLLLGLGLSGLLYYKQKGIPLENNQQWIKYLLFSLRSIFISLIAFFLLGPFLKKETIEEEKPTIVFVQDNSSSVVSDLNEEQQAEYLSKIKTLQSDLAQKYDVEQYTIGTESKRNETIDFSEKVTNISSGIKDIYELYENQNLGAVILATDGIFNEGINPVYVPNTAKSPIYTIALGDTTTKTDLVLNEVLHNQIVYLGDKFSVRTRITAEKAKGKTTTLIVRQGKTVLKRQTISIENNSFEKEIELILDAKIAGTNRFSFSLTSIDNESTTQNNSKLIYVDVLDARQKILMIAAAPHPDLGALKKAIELNKNYELAIVFQDDFNKNIEEYDVLITHQIPLITTSKQLLNKIKAANLPKWMIAAPKTVSRSFNELQNCVKISGGNGQSNEVLAGLNNNFNSFVLNKELNDYFGKMPPLNAAFGDFKGIANAEILLSQRIGTVSTDYPLWSFSKGEEYKQSVLVAEGLWRWRLLNYKYYQNFNFFDELVSKTLQYLSVKEDKSPFRVRPSNRIYNENQLITFSAERYNASFELVNNEDVQLTIKNEAKETFEYTFDRSENAYFLNAGYFPAGNYTYTGRTLREGKTLTSSGAFSIKPIQLEAYNTTANHQILNALSESSGGKMFPVNELNNIAKEILDNQQIKPILYSNVENNPLINWKFIFFVILSLLSLEWFIRKYLGAY